MYSMPKLGQHEDEGTSYGFDYASINIFPA